MRPDPGGAGASRHVGKLQAAFARPGGGVLFVGAGVSIHATGGANAASWRGLLVEGLQRCVDEHGATEDWARVVGGLIETGHLTYAGDLITKQLGGRDSAAYARWLRDTVGALHADHDAWLRALVALRQPLVTTNYDDLLAWASGLPVVTWEETSKLHDVFRDGPERYEAVLHLHGHWRSPRSVVLDLASYEDVRRDAVAQNGLRSWLTTRTALFVGFGGGLDDPNFQALRTWLKDVLGTSPHAHYVLVRATDLAGARKLLDDGGGILPVSYGADWENLPDFLHGLIGPGSEADASGVADSAASGAVPIVETRVGGKAPSAQPAIEQAFASPRASDRPRAASELETLYAQLDELRQAAADLARVTELEETILSKKRRLREGPMPSPGDVFGERYVLDRRIDAGGFGHVWKAWDRTERRAVAVKFLHGVHVGDQSRVDRFFRGAQKQALLDHPNIVRVFDPEGREGDWCYFVMAFVPGTDLRRAVVERTLSREDTLRALGEAAEALEHAWTIEKLVHRDVKPANILIDEEGHARLTDFDLVRAPLSTQGTLPGQAMGSYGFSAPEVLVGGETTRKSDVWSFAMTVLWCLSGGKATREGKQERGDALRSTNLSSPARKALRACLSEDPAQRLDSPLALFRILTEEPAKRPGGPRLLVIVGSVLAVAGLGWWVWRGREPAASQEAIRTVARVPYEPKSLLEEMKLHDRFDLEGLTIFRFFEDGRPDYALDKDQTVVLVPLPAGIFTMGASMDEEDTHYDALAYAAEEPPHTVSVPEFLLCQTPITNEQYARFLDDHTDIEPPRFWNDPRYNQPKQPVVGVTWDDAREYCEWAGLRLPTEAEWEYACRAGKTSEYWSGDTEPDLARVGWYSGNSEGGLHPVGEKPANPFGLRDMHGNVWEWCEDDWSDNYEQSQRAHPRAYKEAGVEARVYRGGSFANPARVARSAYRFDWLPEIRDFDIGFRPAKSITTD